VIEAYRDILLELPSVGELTVCAVARERRDNSNARAVLVDEGTRQSVKGNIYGLLVQTNHPTHGQPFVALSKLKH
jgi:hypothetical protein